ncbi:MAG: geranylgeranyl reductase family protein [Candidatus Nezhaarchaeales archaeon]
MKRFDVAVIGGGPSGLSAAWSASSHNANVILFEEHEEIGVPRHCAGLVSGEGLKLIGMPCKSSFIENKVHRALLLINGVCIELKKMGEPLYVLDREAFDKEMAERALYSGSNIMLNTRVKELERKGEDIVVKTTRGSYLCRLVIDGEGAKASFAVKMGLSGPQYRLPALQMELRGASVHSDEVLVIEGSRWAPGFFAWIIPLSNNEVRVGLASIIGHCDLLLKRLMKRHPLASKVLKNCAVKRVYGGTVVLGPIEKAFTENLMVVGDAAGQTKPLTGGGIIYGSLCGFIAGMIAAKVVERKAKVEAYEKAWRRILNIEEKMGLLIRKLITEKEEDLARITSLGFRTRLISLIEREVHYDYHVTSIIRKPSLLMLSALILTLVNPMKAFKYSLQAFLS